ncbi:MAG: hypothetical protein DWQ05_13195 [Calditrichaeota bacterium]|nr:MAG: hypothetical protein DWQ05_13195 [Calditrichota bacterium]
MEKIFIDENINILTGNDAEKALEQMNDKKYLSDNNGIIQVSKKRWESAQKAEKKHWLAKGTSSIDDRNIYHSNQFHNYSSLKKAKFSHALEIGSGPFTNLRIIGTKCKIEKCTLLDPLITEYLNHPYCSYNENHLVLDKKPRISKILKKVSPTLFSYLKTNFFSRIQIDQLISLPLEEADLTKPYDLVVMINVIEHCYDINKVFNNILKVTPKGSYFIFEDKLYDQEKIKKEISTNYDAAHPLKVDKSVIENFLNKNFKPVYKNVKTNRTEFQNQVIIWDDIYYIGKRDS